MAIAGELTVLLKANIEDLRQGMKKAVDEVNTFGKNSAKTFSDYKYAIGIASGAVGGLVAGLVAVVKKTADYGEELARMSRQTGISVETLAKLRFAAEQEETSIEALVGGMKMLSRQMAEVGDRRSPYERLLELSDSMKEAKSPAEQAGIAFKFFGRQGQELIMRKKCIHATKRKRGPYPNPMRERVNYKFTNEATRIKSIMRHAWYRKSLKKVA